MGKKKNKDVESKVVEVPHECVFNNQTGQWEFHGEGIFVDSGVILTVDDVIRMCDPLLLDYQSKWCDKLVAGAKFELSYVFFQAWSRAILGEAENGVIREVYAKTLESLGEATGANSKKADKVAAAAAEAFVKAFRSGSTFDMETYNA